MSTKLQVRPTEPERSHQAVCTVVRDISSLAANDEFKYLDGLIQDNSRLDAEVKELSIARKQDRKSIAELEADLAEEKSLTAASNVKLEKAKRKIEELQRTEEEANKKISAQRQELEANGGDMTKLQKAIKKSQADVRESNAKAELETTRALAAEGSVAEVTKQLTEAEKNLQSLTIELNQLESFKPEPKDANPKPISGWLDGIRKSAYNLITSYCGGNVDEDVLSNADLWDAIRSYTTVSHRRIPLPVTNSPVAKHVRIAALLSITSSILKEQVFQPNYLLKQNNEICDLLDDIIDEDAKREQHLRAELVALLPERQKENGKARVESAVKRIASYCIPLVPKDKDPSFMAALNSFCNRAYKGWAELQRYRQRVEPVFEEDPDVKWLLLPLPNQTSDGKSQNGQSSTMVSSQNSGTGNPRATYLEPAEQAKFAEIKVVSGQGSY
ncbi:mei5 protein [Apiospora kogelbergensis]|uniref:Mei5 protein n=1 Tax=Apiospora kogelbergensis TaxID=1337665 RepID=A0AAW0R2W4_9PEZI